MAQLARYPITKCLKLPASVRHPTFETRKKLLNQFYSDNQIYVECFKKHSECLLKRCPTVQKLFSANKLCITLTGSRSFDLAYPESDLEFAFILHDDSTQDGLELLKEVKKFYEANGLGQNILTMKTKAGLDLLVATPIQQKHPNEEVPVLDNTIKGYIYPNKLEITVRRVSEHQKSISRINEMRPKMDDEEQYDYIVNMRQLLFDSLKAKQNYNECKKRQEEENTWLRSFYDHFPNTNQLWINTLKAKEVYDMYEKEKFDQKGWIKVL